MSKPLVIAGGRGLGKSWVAEIVKRAQAEQLAQMELVYVDLEMSYDRVRRQCDQVIVDELVEKPAAPQPKRRCAQWKQERNAHRRNWR